jgi:putative transposase
MRRVPENRFQSGKMFFVTMSTLDRQPRFLDNSSAQAVLDSLQFFRQRKEFELYAYVIMPDHIHVLVRLFPPLMFSAWARRFKSYTTHALGRKSLWQTGSWTKDIESQDILTQKLSYIHSNPVRKNLCDDPAAYPWSSAREYYSEEFRLVTA